MHGVMTMLILGEARLAEIKVLANTAVHELGTRKF